MLVAKALRYLMTIMISRRLIITLLLGLFLAWLISGEVIADNSSYSLYVGLGVF